MGALGAICCPSGRLVGCGSGGCTGTAGGFTEFGRRAIMSSKSKLGCAIDAAAFGAQLWSRLRARSILPPLHAGVGGQLGSGLLVSGQKKKYILFALVSAGVACRGGATASMVDRLSRQPPQRCVCT